MEIKNKLTGTRGEEEEGKQGKEGDGSIQRTCTQGQKQWGRGLNVGGGGGQSWGE